MTSYNRAFAAVDLAAIQGNFDTLSALLPRETKKLCVVKADGYGHGAVPVARALRGRADYFAVACLEEALTLREAQIREPILILSYTHPSRFPALIEKEICATVYTEEDAIALSHAAEHVGKCALCHVKVDTGMGRVGFSPTKASADAVARIKSLPSLRVEGLFSHLARADEEDKTSAQEQIALFDGFLALLEERGARPALCHLLNSAGVIEGLPPYDMCRFGIALYGLTPSEEVTLPQGIRPAMSLKSHVIHLKKVPQGFPVGYGQIWRAPRESVVATVSIGYADGVRRDLTGKGEVLIRGRRLPIVGKICMDQLMVDATTLPDISVDDEVTLFGRDGDATLPVEEYAARCHSFNYEAVCAVLPRVTRVYREK